MCSDGCVGMQPILDGELDRDKAFCRLLRTCGFRATVSPLAPMRPPNKMPRARARGADRQGPAAQYLATTGAAPQLKR